MPQFPEFPSPDTLRSDRTSRVGFAWIEGPDRIAFLTRIMAGALPPAPGAARTALLGPRGNLIVAGVAVVLPDAVVIECERSRAEALIEGLDRYRISDDVEIRAAEEGTAVFSMENAPHPEDESAAPGAVRPGSGSYVRREFRPWPAFSGVAGDGLLPGFRPLREDAAVIEATPEQQEYLRILAGEPRWGAELDEGSLPLQSGLAAHVRLGAGCYIGQEYVARQAHRGRVPKLLRRLDFEADAPESDAPVAGLEVSFEGRTVGRVTSAVARSENWKGPPFVALAILAAEVPPGAAVAVASGGRAVVAEV